jgi:hypothetical protein
MTGLPQTQTWRCRVAELLDDPVARAVLRRDGLTDSRVYEQLAPIARHLRAVRLKALPADAPRSTARDERVRDARLS